MKSKTILCIDLTILINWNKNYKKIFKKSEIIIYLNPDLDLDTLGKIICLKF